MSRTTTTVATERALDLPDTPEQRWWAIEELRSQRPDLAKWIDTMPELGELLMVPAWRAHVDRLPNPSATPTSILLDVWARAVLGSTPNSDTPGLPAPITLWLEARALAAQTPDSWPGAALAPLVARCVYTLAPDRGAILAHLLVWRDRLALAACLAEPIGLADAQAYVDRQASLADALLLVDALLDAEAGSAVASLLERARQRWQRRPDVLAQLTQRAERAGLGELAMRFAQESVALDPEQADARLAMARAMLDSGSPNRAMQIQTDTLRATKRQLARVFAALADASRAAGEFRHARRAYAHAFACDPEQPRIAVALAELLFAEGRAASARKILERVGPAQSVDAAGALVRHLLATGDRSGAARLAAQTVERFPGSAHAYMAQADVARADNRHAAARDALARAILAAPAWHAPRLQIAEVLADEGQDAQALAAYRSLLTIAPAHVPARHGQARMLARMGALDDAVQNLETLIASFPDEPLYYADLGAVHTARGAPEQAHQAYRRAWELAPGDPQHAQTYAQALVQRGEADYALTVLGQAVAITPTALPLHRMRAGLYVQSGDYRAALGSYEQAFAAQPDAATAVAAARIAHTLSERAQARNWLARALRLDAALPDAWLLAGQLHEQEGRFAAAARRYEQAMQLGAARQHVLDVARVRERGGDRAAAAALLERVVAQGQYLDQALHALGMIRQRQGQHHEALELAHRFADLPSPGSAPLSWAAETLADAGQHRAAIELLRPVLGQPHASAEVLSLAATLYLALRDATNAMKVAQQALALQPGMPGARMALAHVYARAGERGRARDTAGELVDDERFGSEASGLLAELLEQEHNLQGALTHATRALARDPQRPERRAHVARLLLGLNLPQRAVEVLPSPLDAPALAVLRARAELKLGQRVAAERLAESARQHFPNDRDVAMLHAELAADNQSPTQTREAWSALVRRFPDDLLVLERYAEYALHAGDAPRAISALRRVIASDRTRSPAIALLGQAYLAAGQAADAVRALRFVLPSAATTEQRNSWRVALARAYGDLEWDAEAIAELDAVLAHDGEHRPARRLRGELSARAGDLERARADLEAVQREDDPGAAESLATVLERMGDTAGALAAIRRALLVPTPERQYTFARIARAAGDSEAAITALAEACCQVNEPNWWAELAQAYATRTELVAALEAWERALELDPNQAGWWQSYADLLLATGDQLRGRAALERALVADPKAAPAMRLLADFVEPGARREELLRAAIAIEPGNAEYWHALGRTLVQQDDGTGAAYAFRQAYELDPDNKGITLDYTDALMGIDDRMTAVTVLERASVSPDAPAVYLGRLAYILSTGMHPEHDIGRLPAAPDNARSGLARRAIELYSRAYEREPGKVQWLVKAALLAQRSGCHEDALRMLGALDQSQLSEQEQHRVSAHRAASRFLVGDISGAVADASAMIANPDYAASMHTILALAAASQGRHEQAIAYATEARERGADSAALLGALGMSLVAGKQFAQAIEPLEMALEHTSDASWMVALSQSYQAAGRRERSLTLAAQAVRVEPANAAFHAHLAALYQEAGRLHEARASLIQAIALRSDEPAFHARMAVICTGLGMTDAANKSMERARQLAPSNNEYVVEEASLRVRQGNRGDAMSLYKQALKAEGQRADWHAELARIALDEGDIATALQHARITTQLEPANSDYWQLLADAHDRNGDRLAVRRALGDAIKALPGNVPVRIRAAHAALETGAAEQAIAIADEAIALAPEDPAVWEVLGEAQRLRGDLPAARRALERAAAQAPRRASVHASLARVALAQNDRAAALQAAVGATDYEPSNASYQVILSRALWLHGRAADAAAVLGDVLPDQLPPDADLCRWYAEIVYAADHADRAIEALDRAIALDPLNAELFLAAGRAHRQLRHYRRAVEYFRRAIRLRPNYPDAIIELSSLGPLAFAASAQHNSGSDKNDDSSRRS